jgi:3-carboxy-cis,cis-muconate cycloisomerase
MLFQPSQSESLRAVFSDERQLQTMLDFEAALARAEARVGMIPKVDAENIGTFCHGALFDQQILSASSAISGNVAIPVIQQLTDLVRIGAPGSEAYVHWGATSQDVIDTGLVLQLRDMMCITEETLHNVCGILASLCRRYVNTPMAGRTWLQHAVPITFGLKVAASLDAMLRHQERLAELKHRVLVLQFGGAAGTLASLGTRGKEVASALAEELKLGLPSMSWHAHRDRIVEIACFYGLLMGTVGKIARDLSLLMQTEIGEVSEPHAEANGGSSTMPHKHNPVAVASMLAMAIRVPGLLSTMVVAAMSQEHERALGGWQAEWSTLPDLCTTSEGALETLAAVLERLIVDEDSLQSNLEKTGGLILAEAVSMALAEKIGKPEAHALIRHVTQRASSENTNFRDTLLKEPAIQEHFSLDEIDKLLNPAHYLGSSADLIRGVLDAYETCSIYYEKDGQ